MDVELRHQCRTVIRISKLESPAEMQIPLIAGQSSQAQFRQSISNLLLYPPPKARIKINNYRLGVPKVALKSGSRFQQCRADVTLNNVTLDENKATGTFFPSPEPATATGSVTARRCRWQPLARLLYNARSSDGCAAVGGGMRLLWL